MDHKFTKNIFNTDDSEIISNPHLLSLSLDTFFSVEATKNIASSCCVPFFLKDFFFWKEFSVCRL
jgi:hypothetical protein